MNAKNIMSKNAVGIVLMCCVMISGIIFGSNPLYAQVKIGTAPTAIGANNNLEVEASTTGRKVSVDKVTGKVTIADGSQGTDKVLTSDANGVATWQTQNVGCASFDATRGSQTVPVNNLNSDPYTTIIATTEVYDPANVYNNVTGQYVVPQTGFYAFKVSGGDFLAGVTSAARNTTVVIQSSLRGALTYSVAQRVIYNDGTYNTASSMNYLTAGDIITFLESTVHATGTKPGNTITFSGISFSGSRIDCDKN